MNGLGPWLMLFVFVFFSTVVSAGGHSNRSFLVSERSGVAGNGLSLGPSLDRLGRHIAFASVATNLFVEKAMDCSGGRPGLQVACANILIRNGTTEDIVVATKDRAGRLANLKSQWPFLSGAGTRVVFSSDADNLVDNDTNGWEDVFAKDLRTGVTVRANLGYQGQEARYYSPIGPNHGRYCAIYCGAPSISGPGRHAVFSSWSDNLIAGDDNHRPDVFLRDLESGTTELISKNMMGTVGNGASYFVHTGRVMTDDGQVIVFSSVATDLLNSDLPRSCKITPDPSWPVQTNVCPQVYLRNRTTSSTFLLSATQSNEPGSDTSRDALISADGRVAVFLTRAPNLLGRNPESFFQVLAREIPSGRLTTISRASDGSLSNGGSFGIALSDNGRRVAFISQATNLVAIDENGVADAFVADFDTGQIRLVSQTAAGGQINRGVHSIALSGDGLWLAFSTDATNVVSMDTFGKHQVYLTKVDAMNESPAHSRQLPGFGMLSLLLAVFAIYSLCLEFRHR